jgi:hypothetical protein
VTLQLTLDMSQRWLFGTEVSSTGGDDRNSFGRIISPAPWGPHVFVLAYIRRGLLVGRCGVFASMLGSNPDTDVSDPNPQCS